ncbi:AAA domain-containing protein [Kitasatospora herbaricolor]|uniref:AAA domain-containing protein n=1 Tax=Kitasatospora herbaricolor TaxID=68217 RepID=UPI0036DBCA2C
MSSPGAETSGENKLRVRQIFRYLAEAGESRVKPVRSLDESARHLLWLSEVPQGDSRISSFLDASPESSAAGWLRVERPENRPCPLPAAELRRWLQDADLTDHRQPAPPALRESVEVPEEVGTPGGASPATRTLLRRDLPSRQPLEVQYADWSRTWSHWAARKRADAPVGKLYEQLYRIHEDATALGESFELVLSFGLLTWEAEGQQIRRHLLSVRAVLELDTKTGGLLLAADPDAPGPALEESMLDAGQKIRSEPRETILRLLDEAGSLSGPEGIELVHRALEAWAIASHERGSYLPQRVRHRPASTAQPVVSFAPAVILRERSRRTNIEALQGIARQIEQGAEPTGLLDFIAGDGALTAPADGEGPSRAAAGPVETYFALPSNEEQRTIAERLRGNRLVVVQGPPGTGKTHTIANLVTDLLAHGQRVLITSHTGRALKVLKEKLPASVRELCVSRTDEGLVAQQELRGSIQAILERQGTYDEREYLQRIAGNETRLRSARTTQALALTALRAIREQEVYQHPADIGDYAGTLQQIARRLAEDQPGLGWLGPVPAARPGITSAAASALLAAARAYTGEHRAAVESVDVLPGPAELLGPTAFEQAVLAVRDAQEGLDLLRGGEAGSLDESASRLTPGAQDAAALALEAFTAARAAAESGVPGWAAPLLEEALTGQDWQLRGRWRSTGQALEGAREAARLLAGGRVDGLEAYDLATALTLVTALREGLVAGERLRGPLGIRTRLRKVVGDFPERIRIDGLVPDTVEGATRVLHRVNLERHLQDVEREWGAGAQAWQAPTRRLAELEAQTAALRRLGELAERRSDLVAALAAVPVLTVKPWNQPATCDALRDALRARAALRAAELPRQQLAALEQTLVGWADRPGTAHILLRRLLDAVRARESAQYRDIAAELDALRGSLALKEAFEQVRGPVASVLPALARELAERPGDPRWDSRLRHVEQAWAWSAWSARMRDLTDPAAEEKQRAVLAEADADIRITLEKLAADRSWYGCLRRLTDQETVALTSYQQSVGRFGKGTGKYAHRYRAQARESLRECQGAVPAWIMPLYQVTATVPMDEAGRFDVVIIDEASQSGPEALLLAWLGKKIVVVGDDKQVSPANVGVDQEQLFQLQNRQLDALPASRRNLFSPTASFFDIASGLAGGRGRLMLREHFRCMPEIIGFSNELSYHGKLQPLRQYGADRLPPIRTVHVPGAYIEGTGQRQRNRAEAERLVAEIVRCCADPAYRGRSMGVITMLGGGQRQEIEDLLVERLAVDERQQRRIRVGDAEDFQGDERDIVFISLVVSLAGADGPRRPGPFASEAMQQRLNVAVSRARDQIWLFHSVVSTDLGPNDLRRRYLDYCTRPAEEQDGRGLDDVTPDTRHEAFDSLFEQRVFLALRGRRFRVRPQYPAGRFRIDLVVEGGTRRLAVECDGDAFHHEGNADEDAARQRELERVGWTFVRIRGSRFFLDPDRALEPLWSELDRLGIEPEGARGAASGAAPAPAARVLPAPAPAVPPAPRPAAGAVPAAAGAPGSVRVPAPVVRPAPDPAPGPAAAAAAGAVPGERARRGVLRLGPVPAPEPAAGPVRAAAAAPPAATGPGAATAPAVGRPVPAARTAPSASRFSFPVTVVSVNAYRRAQRELHFLEDRIGAPAEVVVAVDAAALAARRAGQDQARARDEERRDFLRAYLDEVTPDPRLTGVGVVVPGSLVGVEHQGDPEIVLYSVSSMPSPEAVRISPNSDLARMLLWSETGEHFSYPTGAGTTEHAVVRFIDD